MDFSVIVNTMDFHRTQKNISLEEYVRQKRIQLGTEVTKKYRIYLDLRFWILLREVELCKNQNQNLVQLLSQIKHLVDNGVAICPISESVFVELMKQSDQATRAATSRLIDRLSLGVTLIVHPQRVAQELCNAIYVQAGASNLFPLDALVWIKLAYLLGETHPYQTPFETNEEELAIQKSIFDHMWNISLMEVVSYIDFATWPQPDWQKTVDILNAEKKQYANELRSFSQAYRAEFEGGLSLFKEDMLKLFKEVDKSGYKDFEMNSENLTRNERFSKFSKSIRTLHIGACCHAAVRWDQKRQLTVNDLLDFHHAEAAIGYCNLFLTENPLKTLVSQRHLSLLSDFPCVVTSSVSEALTMLDKV